MIGTMALASHLAPGPGPAGPWRDAVDFTRVRAAKMAGPGPRRVPVQPQDSLRGTMNQGGKNIKYNCIVLQIDKNCQVLGINKKYMFTKQNNKY